MHDRDGQGAAPCLRFQLRKPPSTMNSKREDHPNGRHNESPPRSTHAILFVCAKEPAVDQNNEETQSRAAREFRELESRQMWLKNSAQLPGDQRRIVVLQHHPRQGGEQQLSTGGGRLPKGHGKQYEDEAIPDEKTDK